MGDFFVLQLHEIPKGREREVAGNGREAGIAVAIIGIPFAQNLTPLGLRQHHSLRRLSRYRVTGRRPSSGYTLLGYHAGYGAALGHRGTVLGSQGAASPRNPKASDGDRGPS